MAGSLCPKCNRLTFFRSPKGRKCTKCNYEMIIPANNGVGGKGKYCPACKKFTVFNSSCRNCGANFIDNSNDK